MLGQHSGLRDKEIRTLQWRLLNLEKRMVTVGLTKTDAGTGRTIPMNDALFAAAIDYAKWYTGRFGSSKPEWYVFPFGRPRAIDPTRPQTSLKTAWRNARSKANVEGRFHDNRHTFVTDLAESGASDQVHSRFGRPCLERYGKALLPHPNRGQAASSHGALHSQRSGGQKTRCTQSQTVSHKIPDKSVC
jgi:integrase